MKHAFYSGISGKIAILFLLAFLLIILPLNSFVYLRLKSTLQAADHQQLKSENEKLLEQLSVDPPIIPLPPIAYFIKVQTTDGQFLNTIFESPGFPELTDELFFIESFDLDSLKILTSTKPIELSGGEIMLTVARSNRQLQTQLADFRLYLFYITGFAVLIIIAGVFAISGLMLKPVKKIIEASGRIASASEFESLPIPKSRDESRELAVALNSMLDRIKTSHEVQQKFFDSATHELKTPLAIMKAELTQVLETGEQVDLKKILLEVLEEVNRLESTISDFLLVSQLRSNVLSLRKEKVNVAELVYEAMKSLKKLAAEHELLFSIQQSDGVDFIIDADADKLKIVISNVLENSIRYSVRKSAIEINLEQRESKVKVQVSNQTQGSIHLAERLGKERYNHSASARGMGLGLWICNQIIILHRGELMIKSEPSTFEVEMVL